MSKKVTLISWKQVKSAFPSRPCDSHKGTFGTAALFCGSRGMAGAAALSAAAAARSGAGLIKVCPPDEVYPIVSAGLWEPVFCPMPQTEAGTLSVTGLGQALQIAQDADACLLGCGLGRHPQTEEFVLGFLSQCETPMVLDADGINLLKGNITILKAVTAPLVLTPHPGEFSRLTGISIQEIHRDRPSAALTLAQETGAVVVLKGAGTIVATPSGTVYRNPTGNTGLSKGGSGDVLSGMMVSFLAQGFSTEDAAVCSVYLHGLAADRLTEVDAQRGMLPSDMIQYLPKLLLEFEAVGD